MTAPSSGTLALSGTNRLVYTPTQNLYGADTFTYTIANETVTNYVLDFDGTDDYVEVSGYTGVTGQISRTIEAWLETSADGKTIAGDQEGPARRRFTRRGHSRG